MSNLAATVVAETLAGLTERSLVTFDGASGRYDLLETVRQYAHEWLRASGEVDEIATRHLEFFLALAEGAEPRLKGSDQADWLEKLERDHENVRVSLDWSLELEISGDSLCLCAALLQYWWTRGYLAEGLEVCERTLSRAEEGQRTALRAKVLNGAGALAFFRGDYAAARGFHEESIAILREIGHRQGVAALLGNLGNLAHEQCDYAAARGYHEESLAILREVGYRQGIAGSLGNLGNVAHAQGDHASARAHLEEDAAFDAAWQEGRAMTIDAAVEYALEVPSGE